MNIYTFFKVKNFDNYFLQNRKATDPKRHVSKHCNFGHNIRKSLSADHCTHITLQKRPFGITICTVSECDKYFISTRKSLFRTLKKAISQHCFFFPIIQKRINHCDTTTCLNLSKIAYLHPSGLMNATSALS